MDAGGALVIEREDVPLFAAALAIALGCALVIAEIGTNSVAALPLIGGTVAFVGLSLLRLPELSVGVFVAGTSMIAGSALVGLDPDLAFNFDGPLGAALFLLGAVGLARRLEE